MSCIGTIDTNVLKGLKQLEKDCGNNVELFIKMINMVLDGNDNNVSFTEEFLSHNDNRSLNLDVFDENNSEIIKDKIKEFFYFKKPSLTEGLRATYLLTKTNTFGYTNIGARTFCIKAVANAIIQNYSLSFDTDDNVKERVSATYFNSAIEALMKAFVKKLTKGLNLDIDKISDRFLYADDHKEEIHSFIVENNITVTDELKNYIALFTEFFSFDDNPDNGNQLTKDFLDDVLKDSRIGDIRQAKNMNTDIFLEQIKQFYEPIYEDLNQDGVFTPQETTTNDTEPGEVISEEESATNENIEENNDEGTDEENEIDKQNETSDNWINQLNQKMGLYGNWLTHVDNHIRSILGSLKRRKTNELDPDGDPVYDTDTPLGIADVMDANVCANVLYRFGQADNVATMMESIKFIAKNLHGFEAFHDLYKLLDGNIELQYKFYRTFSRTLMSKIEIIQDGPLAYSRVTNNNLYRRDLLSFRLIDAVKGTTLNVDDQSLEEAHGKLAASYRALIKNPNFDTSSIRDLSRELAKLYQKFFPFIDEFSIVNYVNNNRSNPTAGKKVIKYKQDNFEILLNELKLLIDQTTICKQNYYVFQQEANIRQESNRIHRKNKDYDKIIPLDDLYQQGYLTQEIKAVCESLADVLEDYVLVASPLNTRNVNGNLNSDVINNSMVTAIKRIFESKLNKSFTNSNGDTIFDQNSPIVKFGEHRFKSMQYELSPIMVEHSDEYGIINYGLFKYNKKTNKYEPTSYSTELLKVALLDGASNIRTGNNALYAQMSGNDYLATCWKTFFRQERLKSPIDGMNMGEYLFRIPADAPRNFMMRTLRYSVDGLVTLSQDAIQERVNLSHAINTKLLPTDKSKAGFANKYTKLLTNPIVVSKGGKYLNENDFLNHINATEEKTINIKIPTYLHKSFSNDENKEVIVTFRYKNNELDRKESKRYLMKGTYEKGELKNAVFVGTEELTSDKEQWTKVGIEISELAWNNILKQSSKDSNIRRNVSRNHRVFKILRNIFLQELKDMAVAANVMFKYDSENKCVDVNDDGTPIFVDGITNTEHNGLHIWYHFADPNDDGKGAIYEEKDGMIVPTGKVFTSDRFILYNFFADDDDPEVINDFGAELMENFRLFRQSNNDNLETILHFDQDNNVTLTDTQSEAIDAMIEDYILANLEFSKESLNDISDFIGDRTDDEILEFALNYNIVYTASNDLFEGDTKFYKNVQTFLKRAKESQGSGVSLGIVDFTRDGQPTYAPIPSQLDKITFTRITQEGIKSPYKVRLYPTFRAVTVFNSVVTDNYTLDIIAKALSDKKVMGNKALSEDDAKKLMDGYKKSVINDAQSYITLDEFIRRVTAKGMLTKYKPLFDKLLDESQELTMKDIKAFIQVQKNFYYDQNYNEYTKVCACRQIKNAEFVLIPRLVRGTELELIAQMMEKLGIDQLNTSETSKASQAYRFTLWDNDGHLNEDVIDDILNGTEDNYKSELFREVSKKNNNTAKEYYNYNYLYVQQETPQHVFNKNKAGIQILKKLVDNIDENSAPELYALKKEFQSLYVANIKESYINLLNRFNVITDSKGNIKVNDDGTIPIAKRDDDGNVISGGVDYKEFFQALREQLMKLGLDSNMIDYCTPDPDAIIQPGTIMPNYMTLVASKLENIVQSIFNNSITRQTLPGFHVAQVSGMGTANRGVLIDDNGHKTLADLVNKKRTSNKLHYHPRLYKHKTNQNAEKITEGEWEKLDPARREEYEVTNEISPYIEIMLPASAFGFDRSKYSHLSKEEQNAEFLKQLKAIGADVILGYRIPTEGKQSLALMKVVGFCDDAYGSTIFLPDAWVAQTGADFDIDSVYGITDYLYFDDKGVIHKEEMMNSAEIEKASLRLWEDYVAKAIGGRIEAITKEEYDRLSLRTKDKLTEAQEAQLALAKSEKEFYENLPEDVQEQLKIIHRAYKVKYKRLDRTTYLERIKEELNLLEREKNYYDDEDIEKSRISDYESILNLIKDSLEDNTIGKINKEYSDTIKSYRLSQFVAYSAKAKERGLMSYDEYKAWAVANPVEANNKRARTNRLVDVIRKICEHKETWEEHFSRSNFDHISDAIKKYNVGDYASKRAARSAYNIFSQAAFQEDAISGVALKAFSVVRDTFCSICNSLKPKLENNSQILVEYEFEGTEDEVNEKIANLRKRFGGETKVNKVEGSTNRVVVLHDMFGWSNDNKNIDGHLITVYSSETTAHILDAIKSGNVQNVNLLTFQVYKTLVDVGSNYDTAVSFIKQPGISRIIKEYNKVNSIYSTEFGKNYIVKAIRQIFDELSISYDYSDNLASLMQKLNMVESTNDNSENSLETNQYLSIARAIFGRESFKFSEQDGNISRVPISAKLNEDRLKEQGIFADKNNKLAEALGTDGRTIRLIFDIQTILQFSKLQNLTTDIRNAAMVSNPDKFGAKQTIFETRDIFRRIVDSLNNDVNTNGDPIFRLRVDGKHLLEALYPIKGIPRTTDDMPLELDEAIKYILENEDFITNSKYKSLAAFIKYATASSILINKNLFVTQSPEFVSLVEDKQFGLASALSGDRTLNKKIVRDFQNYIIGHIVNRSRFLQAPLKYNISGIKGFEYETWSGGTNPEEMRRVLGLNHLPKHAIRELINMGGREYYVTTPITFENINEPTEKELERYALLSPAQKVDFVKTHFTSSSMFDFIKADIFTDANRFNIKIGRQQISFYEDGADLESIRANFEQMFTHTNPIIAMAAADVIKYAFLVEGYKMGSRNVSKMIPNSVLLNEGNIYGTSIVSDSNMAMSSLLPLIASEGTTLIENYVRGHSESLGIAYKTISLDEEALLNLQSYRICRFEFDLRDKESIAKLEHFGVSYTRANGELVHNKYVKFRYVKDNQEYLYATYMPNPNNPVVYLLPMNPLEPSECETFSSNETNNVFNIPVEGFRQIVANFEEARARELREGKNEINVLNEYIRKYRSNIANHIYKPERLLPSSNNIAIDLNSPKFESSIKEITIAANRFNDKDNFKYHFFNDANLDDYIKFGGVENGYTQKVKLNDGTYRDITIYRFYNKRLINKYTGENINVDIDPIDKVYEEYINIVRNAYKTVQRLRKDGKDVKFSIFSAIPFTVFIGDKSKIEQATRKTNIIANRSTIIDAASSMAKAMYRRSYTSDQAARMIGREFKSRNIPTSKQNVQPYTDEIFSYIGPYVKNLVEDLIYKMKNYIKDPDTGEYLPINSKRVMELIRTDEAERNTYLLTLLEPQKIIHDFGIIKTLDIESNDARKNQNLKDIKEAIDKLSNLSIIDDALKNYTTEYLDLVTGNPLANQGMISILDGFYKTNWFNATFNDIQETSNPLIQLIMKRFQTRVNSRNMDAKMTVQEFKEQIEAFKKLAEQRGESFDLDNIIDEYGDFRADFNQKFTDDLKELKEDVDNAIEIYGKYSPEHILARLKYNKWKAKNLEQPTLKEFYDIINSAEEKLIREQIVSVQNGYGGRVNIKIPSLLNKYSEYLKVREERNKLVRQLKINIHNTDLIRRIEELNAELARITSFDDDFYYDPFDVTTHTSYYASEALRKSLKDISYAWNKYYDFVPMPNFQRKYEEMQKIVDSYELSEQNPALYENNEDYVEAKTWLYLNTEKVDIVNSFSVDDFDYQTYPADMDMIKSMLLTKDLKNKYKDRFGIFHPEYVTEEDLEKLYEELGKPNPDADKWFPQGLPPAEVSRYTQRAYNFLDERVFIGSQGLDDTEYTTKFFRGIRGEDLSKPQSSIRLSSLKDTKNWKDTVTALNNLLTPYYNNTTKKIDFTRIPITKEGIKILETATNLLDYLETLSNPTTAEAKFRRKEFFHKYINNRGVNVERWNEDINYYNSIKSSDQYSDEDVTAYKIALDKLMHSKQTSTDRNGNIVRYPRRSLYVALKLKKQLPDAIKREFINYKATENKRNLYKNYKRRLKGSYYEAFTTKQSQLRRGIITQEQYDRWYRLHHRYNYYTHAMEPISIWWELEPKQGYHVIPSNNYKESSVRDGYFHTPDAFIAAKRNPEIFSNVNLGENWDENKYYPELDFVNKNFNPNIGQVGNYKKGNPEYDNDTKISRTEKEAMNYIMDLLQKTAQSEQAKRYFGYRHAPARRKSEGKLSKKRWVQELVKVAGWYSEPYDPNEWYDDVSYGKHKDRPMPMLEILQSAAGDLKTMDYIPIRRKKEGEDKEVYDKYVKETKEENKKRAKINREVHKHLLDRDWVNVISDYIIKAGAYNAVLESKAELFYAQEMLNRYGAYKDSYNKFGKHSFKRDRASSSEEVNEYVRTPDKHLQEQFENQLKRIFYNQYKSSNSPTLVKWMSTLQSVSSASFMMFNFKGGVANVTIGESQILGEAAARTFFGMKAMTKAKGFYMGGLGDYIANSGKDYSSTLQGAIIKWFDVIDYDEHTGVSRLTKNAAEYLRRIRDYAYSPQTAGEHEMQNTALFAMLETHRLVENPKHYLGEPKYTFMNLQEFIYDKHEQALLNILEDKEKYYEFKKEAKKDANKLKKYAWYQKDFATAYANEKLTKEQQRKFVKEKKRIQKEAEAEFNNNELHPTLMSQLKFNPVNGQLEFVHSDTSSGWLGKLHIETKDKGISEAVQILGAFKGRVVSVNKYIHGVYDKSGRALLEKSFVGGLIMQYHKHIPIGLMKRYRIKGMYSEERGAVTKGFIGSLSTFLKMPLEDISDKAKLNPEEAETLVGIQNILRYGTNLVMYGKLYYDMLPEYDRANLRRQIGDLAAVLAAILVTIAVKVAMDDDDDDSVALNFLLYEADRLCTDGSMYLPFVLPTEGKKIIQSPIAANSILTDILGTMGHIAKYILNGADYDMTYQSGKFAGENKIKVYILRRIPIWRGIKTSFLDIVDNNHYYKLGQNMLGFLDIDKRVKYWKNDF